MSYQTNRGGAMAALFKVGFLFLATISFSIISMLLAPSASAASEDSFSAMHVLGGGRVMMEPGEEKQVMVGFQNNGEKTWVKDGESYVSIYTHGPKYRDSSFVDDSWQLPEQPARIKESSVAPGQVGHVLFTLHAPNETGSFNETFHLAAEDTAWIPGGKFTLRVRVQEPGAVNSAPSIGSGSGTNTTQPTVDTSGLSAKVLLRSQKKVVAEGGEAVSYTVGVKNDGTKSWTRRELRVPEIALASKLAAETRHASWDSAERIALKTGNSVRPGQLEFFTFSFNAPTKRGEHTIQYELAVNGTAIPDFYIDIPVEVTSNAPDAINAPVRDDVEQNSDDWIEEPMMRVGVLIVDEETDWEVEVSCDSDWTLKNANGELLGEMKTDEMVRAFYKDGVYWFNRGKGLEKTSYPIRFISEKGDQGICTVENFDRRETRDFTHPDNTFRNALEIRYNDNKERTWLINELPMEYYLRGLAETSNYSHIEFQKALITVARTYALYHWERGTKRGPEGFHVTAYADDQVYNGYGQEQRTPKLTKAVEATRGKTVTYDGETAITPYFSRSDGRTRDWSEVWYGEVEWLKSVPTPCDEGKTLWGHGVGMSASAALCQARNGKKWDDILKYFYQGIELNRHWE
jgi:hypothetical protein